MNTQTENPIQDALKVLVTGANIPAELMTQTMTQIMAGEADPAAIGGLLMALRMKGESVQEITAAAQVMRQFATPVELDVPHLTDIVGTGGDGAGTFNVSTASAFVAATGGVTIAKHGNRSVSSRSGAADLLEAAGCRLDLQATEAEQLVKQVGIAFLFAPQHHGAMRHAIGPRRALGCWSLFNLLGPLTNPAGATQQVLGVFSRERVVPMAEVMQALGAHHVMVVCSEDGLDEISPAGLTQVAELKDGAITESTIDPDEFGLAVDCLDELSVDGPDESLEIVRSVLKGEAKTLAGGGARAIVGLNAGAALYVGGQVSTYKDGVSRALEIIDSGDAWRLLERYAQATQALGGES